MSGQKTRKRPDDWCYTPVAMSGFYGVAVCVLPKGHDGPCDGGAAEKRIADLATAQQIESEDRWA